MAMETSVGASTDLPDSAWPKGLVRRLGVGKASMDVFAAGLVGSSNAMFMECLGGCHMD